MGLTMFNGRPFCALTGAGKQARHALADQAGVLAWRTMRGVPSRRAMSSVRRPAITL